MDSKTIPGLFLGNKFTGIQMKLQNPAIINQLQLTEKPIYLFIICLQFIIINWNTNQ